MNINYLPIKPLKLIYIATLSFILILHSTVIFAQHNHDSHGGGHTMPAQQTPHGGVVKNAGKYKIEMVAEMMLKKDQLSFYLLKNNLKSIPAEEITGSVTIQQKDGTSTTEDLVLKGNERFVAQLKNTNSFQANVKFIVKGKTVSAIFTQNGIGHNVESKYTCSMHPEIESNEPGKCPKCGMTLVPKEDNQGESGVHQH